MAIQVSNESLLTPGKYTVNSSSYVTRKYCSQLISTKQCYCYEQIAALIMWATDLYFLYTFDYVGHGIWAGSFYVVAGSLGLASCAKRAKSM